MRTILTNKLLSLLKACIISGLALVWLTANAEETPEYAAVPSEDCHNAEHVIIREPSLHKYRHVVTHHVTHHHALLHHRFRSPSGLVAYYPFSAPSYYDNMWPSDSCHCCMSGGGCEQNEYAISSLSSDQLMYNLMYESPRPTGPEGAPCDSD